MEKNETKKTTFGQKFKKFVHDNRYYMISGALVGLAIGARVNADRLQNNINEVHNMAVSRDNKILDILVSETDLTNERINEILQGE